MLKSRTKREAAGAARAVAQLAAIHASIVALADEDLLDLADIFARGPSTPLKDLSAREMEQRNLKL